MTKLSHYENVELPFQPYAFSFSSIFTKDIRLAVASFNKNSNNQINIYRSQDDKFVLESEIKTIFPQTRICFCPQGTLTPVDIFLSCDTKVSLYKLEHETTSKSAEILISQKNDPIPCADWNKIDPSLAVFGCVDGTAALVDVITGQIITKIQTHDHPVYDVSFFPTSSAFVTAGLDGSLRFFDIRDLESSLIFYQASMPVQRVMVSPFESNLVAALVKGSSKAIIVDNRQTGVCHTFCGGCANSPVRAIAWSKLSPAKLFTAHQNNMVFSSDIRKAISSETIYPFFDADKDPNTVPYEKCYQTEKSIQSMHVGPMTIAVSTLDSIEFIEGEESPPPLVTTKYDV